MAKTSKEQESTALIIDKGQFKQLLAEQIEKGTNLASSQIQTLAQLEEFKSQYWAWHSYSSEILKQSFNKENNEYKHQFDGLNFYSGMGVRNPTGAQKMERYFKDLKNDIEYINNLSAKIPLLKISNEFIDSRLDETPPNKTILTNIFNKFHQIAIQLLVRHANRPTLIIGDEYDVQDSLHALLKLHFDDIRAEEYTPSYAGSSTRMDFLLKNEKIVIEVKKTRNGLGDRELGQELTIDIAFYKNHPDCSELYCFVYDPENRIRNPRGIENDLARQSMNGFKVNVFIRP